MSSTTLVPNKRKTKLKATDGRTPAGNKPHIQYNTLSRGRSIKSWIKLHKRHESGVN